MKGLQRIVFASAFAIALICAPAFAQNDSPNRKELKRSDLSGAPGMEVILSIGEYKPGDSIGLHPLWLMFALFAFGYLFGFLGLLLAVPLAAAVGVLVRFAVDRYLHSPLYKTGAN